jgi:hypothetical protein
MHGGGKPLGPGQPQSAAVEAAPVREEPSFAQRLTRAYRWHALAFLALNGSLGLINALLGGYWWSFWPLFITGLALAVHYCLYKAVAVDEGWVEERTQELNLKSYDRSHIEDLKSRYGDGDKPGGDRR